MVALDRINVKQWKEKTTKSNLFSMYFVRNNEEIHLSFKNSEKWRTQALIILRISLKNTRERFIL